MKVLTEATLRGEFKRNSPKKYFVDKNVIITPSAKQYLKEKNVELCIGKEGDLDEGNAMDNPKDEVVYEKIKTPYKKISPKYISYYSGGAFEEKPEHMTQIYGNKLVYKDDLRIVFRGKLDSLQSKILELQVLANSKNKQGLLNDLEDVLQSVRDILRAEVLNENLNNIKVIGLDEKELRAMSHNPKKHFKIGHILPNYSMGEIIIKLNSIRSSIRETELSCIKAFRKDSKVERVDIIKALNRLSSGVYIMMCKEKANIYK
ncbi:hypothetical protein [Dethiothermospora halolimnae]|uniref:hypothetical protein n=1 Tax=Dethiothermospora halolimnae TaxID=3114390 RepID=UPI003CCC16B6